MGDALIGHTGYVGSTLLRQRSFVYLYRSTDISQSAGQEFGTVVCAGVSAQKWIANREPAADAHNIRRLMACLDAIKCKRFVLISTVDVFKHPRDVDEQSEVGEEGLHPYGLHRRMLERFVEERFSERTIVRLPGVVGPGLRKNVAFDLKNNNNLHAIDSRAVYQFYPMVNLWSDISTAVDSDLPLIHLTAEPLSVRDVAAQGFGRSFLRELPTPPARYDMQTRHAARFGSAGRYQYSRRESMLAIRCYAQFEAGSQQRAQ